MSRQSVAMPGAPTGREQLHAALLAALCALLFLGPALLPGRCLVPYPPECMEPMRSAALADGVPVAALERGNLAMGDKYHQSLAWDRIIRTRLTSGEFPLWTRDIGGGAVFAPQMGQPYQPWNLLLLGIPAAEWYGPVVFLHLVVLGWLAYRFLRRVGCRHESALLGLVCAVLGVWLQGRVHQNVVISAALPLFWALSSVHAAFFGARPWRAAGSLALAIGLSWLGGFAPVSLQMSYLCGAFAVVLAIARSTWRPLLPVAVGFGLGGLVALAQMAPTLLAAAETSRAVPTGDQLAGVGLDFTFALGALWPDLLVWPDPGTFSGRPPVAALLLADRLAMVNFTEAAFGAGLAGSLAIAALLGRRHGEPPPLRRALTALFAAVAIGGFLLATATTPWRELSAVVPGARSGDLRRFLFSVHAAIVVLAAFGADRLLAGARPRAPRIVAAAVAVASAIVLLLHLRAASAVETDYVELLTAVYAPRGPVTEDLVRAAFLPGEVDANRWHLLATSLRALVVAAAAWLALRRSGRWTVPILCALAVVELLHAGRGNRLAVAAERVADPPALLAPVLDATRAAGDGPRPRLVMLRAPDDVPPRGLFAANLPGYWGVEHLGAYNPLPKLRMEELFLALEPDREGKRSVVFPGGGSGVDALRDPRSIDHPLLDLLGVSWLVASAPCDSPRLVDRTPDSVPDGFRVHERRGALPRATFVDRARVVEAASDRLAILGDPLRDPRREVLLEDPAAPAALGDGVPDAEVRVVRHADEAVVVRVVNREPGYLRLADPYDGGWTARAGGCALEVYAADHYLRAVFLEPGEHEVVFRFDAARVWLPRWLAAVAVLASAVLVWGRRRARHPRGSKHSRP